ncbi:2-phosphosulfolactate phosphatase family protein [Gloeothece verrucosa]|uniref:Probable 2-phosphosulfolactate phosphatase n=1 Tax=Gloeothece verrucosa (strain PCC 7822) TaxID=497965 RepID=E0UDD5_GLOV7|nr:2-phosphosulfolactate phosphatase family protein [Gloeothece verrucosa]ADN14126.1 2-phosphosulfolactate phosphatase [Gloeothece verrucosa PCC 7822]
MKLFVYHTPELTPTHDLPDCAVVIDVLRATTTISTALNAGAEAVQAFSSLEQLLEVSSTWLPEKRLLAGERGGAKVEGCDLGNSPLDCSPELVQGKRLFISTTNGTRALQRVEQSHTVLAAALINRKTIVSYLLEKNPSTVWLLGSGWQGGYSLEDAVCAGAIADLLMQHQDNIEIGNDEVIAARALYTQWQNNLLEMFHKCSHGQRLLGLNCHEDLKYCAQTDFLDILPIQKEPGVLIKG